MFDWLKRKYGKGENPDEMPYTTESYDEYIDLISQNEDDPDILRNIATGIGLNKTLTQAEKDTLLELIDECLARGG